VQFEDEDKHITKFKNRDKGIDLNISPRGIDRKRTCIEYTSTDRCKYHSHLRNHNMTFV